MEYHKIQALTYLVRPTSKGSTKCVEQRNRFPYCMDSLKSEKIKADH